MALMRNVVKESHKYKTHTETEEACRKQGRICESTKQAGGNGSGKRFPAVTSIACGFIAFISFIGIFMFYASLSGQAEGHVPHDPHTKFYIFVNVVLTPVFGIASYGASRMYKNALERLSRMNTVVPLTRANAADLPVTDSSVRAASEPMQAQKSVLLRATTGESRDQKVQLLRADAGEQK